MEKEAKEALRREREAKKSSEDSITLRQQSPSSESEADSPIKQGIAARKQRVGMEEHSAKRTIRSLKDELEGMSTDGINALGESIFAACKAKAAKDHESPVIQGKVFHNRHTQKHSVEDLVCDSGCTMSVVSKSICEDNQIPIIPLNATMIIRDASGNTLNIMGTSKIYIENLKVLGPRRRMIEAAVLTGNEYYREVLVSLQV